MNRAQIMKTADCPKCGAKKGQPCIRNDKSKASHVERTYMAQDIVNGRPTFRATGEENPDAKSKACPECGRVLKSPQALREHMKDKHEDGGTRNAVEDDDFDVIEDFEPAVGDR